MRRFTLGGIEIDPVTLTQAVDRIEGLVAAGRGGCVFTPNVDHVVIADRSAEFRAAYMAADVSLPDGMPIVWSSRLLGEPLPQKVSGADLVLPLAARAAESGWRVFLLGAAPGIARAAADRLREKFPTIYIVGVDAPSVTAEGTDAHSDAAIERIRMSRAELVLVAFGAPKQELWIFHNLERLRPAVAVGIGGSLDFVSGRIRRAPRWMSDAGLEWLWRLSREPRRLWRRYLLEDPRFAFIVLREMRRRRSASVQRTK